MPATTARPVLTQREDLVAQLRALGVRAGDAVMVHASMRKLGPVEGGAAGVIAALREAVGVTGNLLMVLGAVDDRPFDALTSPTSIADMGVLAEAFRVFPGVQVNDHAADRFAVLGPDAAFFLEPAPLHDYHGPGSVLERLTQRSGVGSCTAELLDARDFVDFAVRWMNEHLRA